MDAQTAKKKAVLERIESLEDAIQRARAYLETGEHADWHGFRPLFVSKWTDGKEQRPHKSWVQSTFIPRQQKALLRAEKALERLEQADAPRSGRRRAAD